MTADCPDCLAKEAVTLLSKTADALAGDRIRTAMLDLDRLRGVIAELRKALGGYLPEDGHEGRAGQNQR